MAKNEGEKPRSPGSLSTFETVVTIEFAERREDLATSFPSAHRFLVDLEALCRKDPRYHLGTFKNVHVYLDTKHLMYLRVSDAGLILRGQPNANIKVGTTDASQLLFDGLLQDIVDASGEDGEWAELTKGQVEVSPEAPAEFFDRLLAALKGLGD